MTIDLTLDDEQQLLAESVRAFVRRDCPPSRVRAADAGQHDPGLWRTIAGASLNDAIPARMSSISWGRKMLNPM